MRFPFWTFSPVMFVYGLWTAMSYSHYFRINLYPETVMILIMFTVMTVGFVLLAPRSWRELSSTSWTMFFQNLPGMALSLLALYGFYLLTFSAYVQPFPNIDANGLTDWQPLNPVYSSPSLRDTTTGVSLIGLWLVFNNIPEKVIDAANWVLYSLLRSLEIRRSGMSFKKSEGGLYELEVKGCKLLLSKSCAAQAGSLWKEWERYYLPDFSLEGKTVLDIGAGQGETAAFFLSHGAKRVVAVEMNHGSAEILKKNVTRNGWDIIIKEKIFELSDLDVPHDYLKHNTPRASGLILGADSLKPCVIAVAPELEGIPDLHQQIAMKFGLRIAMERWQRMEKTHFYYLK